MSARGRSYLLAVCLVLVAVFSALERVGQSYLAREQFRELQRQREVTALLETQYGQLLLEHGAWSTPGRIEQVVKEQLEMKSPKPEELIKVQ